LKDNRWPRWMAAFAIAALGVRAPVALASTMPTAAFTSVGPAGGVLETTDGAFTVTVVPDVITPGNSLSISDSTQAPAGAPALPSSSIAVGPYVQIGGQTLVQPQVAVAQYNGSFLGNTPADRISLFDLVNGAWQFIPTAAVSGQTAVTAYISGPGTYVLLANTSTFSDVSSSYWASGSIDVLAGAAVMNGMSDGTFAPEAGVTRAQFAKMLALTLGLQPASATATSTAAASSSASAPMPFSDVPVGAWYTPYVEAVFQAGLMQGTTATTFAPDALVTRDQMAVLITRALKLSGTATLAFTDAAQIEPWAASGVQAAVAAGYLTGYPDGTFRPLAPLTRAQAASVLARVILHRAP
jgi:hypothetical protein